MTDSNRIDWTKPVYRIDDEKFECPGRVLCTDGPGEYPVVIAWRAASAVKTYTLGGLEFSGCPPAVRNAPEKPELVQYERWVNLYPDGRVSDYYLTRAGADKNATSHRLYPHRIVWNSDGSPVDEQRLTDAEREVIEAARHLSARWTVQSEKSKKEFGITVPFGNEARALQCAVLALDAEGKK